MKAFYKENIPTKNTPTPKTPKKKQQKHQQKDPTKKPNKKTQDLLILRNLAGHEFHHGLAPEKKKTRGRGLGERHRLDVDGEATLADFLLG